MARDRDEIVKDACDALKKAGLHVPESYEPYRIAAMLSVVMVSYQAQAQRMRDLVDEIEAHEADEILARERGEGDDGFDIKKFSDGRREG